MQPTEKQEVLALRAGLLDPRLQDVPRCLCDLELDRTLRLVLNDDGVRRHLVVMKRSLRALYLLKFSTQASVMRCWAIRIAGNESAKSA